MKSNEPEIIDVEVISSQTHNQNSNSQHGGYRQSYYQQNEQDPFRSRGATYSSMYSFSAPGSQGLPIASTVTLAIFFACLLQWGFLAALGFMFFYAVGSALGMYYKLRMILSGRIPNPWVWRIGNWIVSLLLVHSLV